MDNILNFLANNYIYFLIGSVVLLFFLIGYIVVEKKGKKKDENASASVSNNGAVTPEQTAQPAQADNTVQMQTAPAVNEAPMTPTVEAPSLDALNANTAVAPTEENLTNSNPDIATQTVASEPVQESASIFDSAEANAQLSQLPPEEPVTETPTLVIEDNSTPVAEAPVEEVPSVQETTTQDVVVESTPVQTQPTAEVASTEPVVSETPVAPVVEAPAIEVPSAQNMDAITPQDVVMEPAAAEVAVTEQPAVAETPAVEVPTQEPVAQVEVQPEITPQDSTTQNQ